MSWYGRLCGPGGRAVSWLLASVPAVLALGDGPGGLRAAGMDEPADAVEQP